MKPLILEFVEIPVLQVLDNSLIEYSSKLNLSVVRNTEVAAIEYVSLDTETFTKATGESSDLDRDYRSGLRQLLDTSTETFDASEQSDSDDDLRKFRMLMDTQTITETVEMTDSDR